MVEVLRRQGQFRRLPEGRLRRELGGDTRAMARLPGRYRRLRSSLASWPPRPAWISSAQRLAAARDLLAEPGTRPWLADADAAGRDGPIAPTGPWPTGRRERPEVMRDLIAVRPDLVVGMIRWYRIAEILPTYPSPNTAAGSPTGGRSGIRARFQGREEAASAAFDLFAAAGRRSTFAETTGSRRSRRFSGPNSSIDRKEWQNYTSSRMVCNGYS
jgi:hypothetical protein